MKRSDSRIADVFTRFVLLSLAVMLVAIASARLGYAQVLYGTLVGRVEDQSAAVLPGAKVTVTNKDTGQQRETTTDESGSFAFRDLQAGVYDLKVVQSGFKSYAKAGVIVTINNIAREDIRMEVGAAAESITVTAEASVLQTDRADVSAHLDQTQVTNLPLTSGRNFQQLYKLIPGASPPVELHSDAGNPQRALGTNFNGVSAASILIIRSTTSSRRRPSARAAASISAEG